MKGKLSLAGLLLLAAALIAVPAQGAMWVGVEGGPNWVGNTDIKAGPPDGGETIKNVKFSTTVMGGLTIGYHFINQGFLAYDWPNWMKYFQFAIDISYHRFVSSEQRGTVFVNNNGPGALQANHVSFGLPRLNGDALTIAFLFIGCYGFYPDSVAPFGRVVPYIGVGPAILQTWVSASGRSPTGEDSIIGPYNFNVTSTDIALIAEAGVRFMALKNVSLDVAFRYRWAQPSYDTGGGTVLEIKNANLFNALVRANYHF